MGPLIHGHLLIVNPTALHDPQLVQSTNAEEFCIEGRGLTTNYAWINTPTLVHVVQGSTVPQKVGHSK